MGMATYALTCIYVESMGVRKRLKWHCSAKKKTDELERYQKSRMRGDERDNLAGQVYQKTCRNELEMHANHLVFFFDMIFYMIKKHHRRSNKLVMMTAVKKQIITIDAKNKCHNIKIM